MLSAFRATLSAPGLLLLHGAGLCLGFGIAWLCAPAPQPEVARAFLPGELGREAGAAPTPAGAAAYRTRHLWIVENDGGEWARANQLTPSFNFSHAMNRIFPPALAETHPEYFPLVNGQRLCPPDGSYYWNPDLGREDVARHAAEVAQRFFDENPSAESFALGVNDGLTFGESPETLALTTPRAWFRGRPDYSRLVFTFMNRVAADVERTHPQKYLGALAYFWAENAPDFPVHRQVAPFLTADRSQGYDPRFWREEMLLQRRWADAYADEAKASRRIGLYDYLYGQTFLVPRIHTRLIAESIRHARRVGFTDYFAETIPNWGLDGPMPWLVAQLLRDPEQSSELLLEEYYRRMFRESAAPMRAFFERCERQWRNQSGDAYWLKHYRNEAQAALFPSAVCAELRALLDDAAARAKSDLVRRRVAFHADAFGVTERFVAMQEARGRLASALMREQTPPEELVRWLHEFWRAREAFVAEGERVLREQPLALGAISWRDWLRNDPTAWACDVIAAKGGDAAQLLGEATPESARILVEACAVAAGRNRQSVLRNGALAGPRRAERREAGLLRGLPTPENWICDVEPAERFSYRWSDDERAVLAIAGAKSLSLRQWNTVPTRGLHRATIWFRGRVAPDAEVNLGLGWRGADGQRFQSTIVRVPPGEWTTWTRLQIAAIPPEGATDVGLGLTLENQSAADWAEIREFTLEAFE